MANLIEKYPVPLIFKKILKDHLSGELEVTSENILKRFFFQDGELQFATSNIPDDRLGEVLHASGKITREQWAMLKKMRENSNDKYGKLVVQHRILSRQGLYSGLQQQIKEIAMSTFYLTEGQWRFTTQVSDSPEIQQFSVHLANVVIGGTKGMADLSYFRERFRFRSPVVLPMPEEVGQALSLEEIKFYVRLTKCGTIPCEQIISVLNLDEREFWRQVSVLYLLSVIDFTEFRVNGAINEQVELINDLHEKLSSHSIDHYELLDLKDTVSVSEVRDKYFTFTKKYAPESIKVAPDSKTMEKSGFIIQQAALAYETLSSSQKKSQYDTGQTQKSRLKVEKTSKENEKKGQSTQARNLYLQANSLYEQKNFTTAMRLMEEAVNLDSSRASYFLLLGLCQSRIPSMRPYAEKNFLKVAEKEPWNADPLFYLGQLYWAENLVKKAEMNFRKALEINMEHTLAAKMIRKIEAHIGSKHKSPFAIFKKKQ